MTFVINWKTDSVRPAIGFNVGLCHISMGDCLEKWLKMNYVEKYLPAILLPEVFPKRKERAESKPGADLDLDFGGGGGFIVFHVKSFVKLLHAFFFIRNLPQGLVLKVPYL